MVIPEEEKLFSVWGTIHGNQVTKTKQSLFGSFWKARLFMCLFLSKCFVAILRAIAQRGRCRRWRSVPWNWKAPSIDGTNVGLVSEIAGTGFGSFEWGGSKGIVEVDSKLGGGFKAFLCKFYPYFWAKWNPICLAHIFHSWVSWNHQWMKSCLGWRSASVGSFGNVQAFLCQQAHTCPGRTSFDMTSSTLKLGLALRPIFRMCTNLWLIWSR